MSTGENEQGLRKVLDMTPLISIILLTLHFYYECYALFKQLGWTFSPTDRLLLNIQRTGLFRHFHTAKWLALVFLSISLFGAQGKKTGQLRYATAIRLMGVGLLLYFGSYFLLLIGGDTVIKAVGYISITSIGFLLLLSGGTVLSRIIKDRFNNNDIFNEENETFPQEERLLQNEFSINLPAVYQLKKKQRKSWINIINPFRSLLVLGSPGAGKSYFVIRHVITQHLQKGFSMFVYDSKFDDLSVIVYNHFLKNRHVFTNEPTFYVINFDDLNRSHRCNPLDKENMLDITDAAESARTILMGLNREWTKKQGTFCGIAHQFSDGYYLVPESTCRWRVLHLAPRHRTNAGGIR